MQFEEKLAKILLKKKETLCIAESCTGGLLTHRLTNIPGSSAILRLGIIAYANQAKKKLLKVPSLTIKKYGAVSLPVARLMAQNVRKILPCTWGIGITGIAGPGGGTKTKPVGLVYIAVAGSGKTVAQQYHFKGSRLAIKNQTANQALKMLLCALS